MTVAHVLLVASTLCFGLALLLALVAWHEWARTRALRRRLAARLERLRHPHRIVVGSAHDDEEEA